MIAAYSMSNKPFHLTPGLAPCGRSVRRRCTAALARPGDEE